MLSTQVLLGEPAVCGPVVDACPKLIWLQSTFAGCNQLLTGSARRDYAATRLAGCFGPCMAEYAALHILALERRYEEQRSQQSRRQWVGPRDAPDAAGGDYRRLSSLTVGVLGLGEIGSSVAKALSSGFGMQVVGCRRRADPRPSDAAAGVSDVYPLEELPRFLGRCDYLVSVLPSTAGTHVKNKLAQTSDSRLSGGLSLSARWCSRLPRASASFGQSAASAALTGHTGLVFRIGGHAGPARWRCALRVRAAPARAHQRRPR